MDDNKTRKFPNGGYDVIIVDKDDILNTIEQNITDKEIMTEIINQLEVDIRQCVKEEKWTGVPFLGSIRIPPVKQFYRENKLVKKEAFETLNRKEFLMFMIKNAEYAHKIIRGNRLYKHRTSIAVSNNLKLYRSIAKEKGDVYARLSLYFKCCVIAIENEIVNDDEIENNDGC